MLRKILIPFSYLPLSLILFVSACHKSYEIVKEANSLASVQFDGEYAGQTTMTHKYRLIPDTTVYSTDSTYLDTFIVSYIGHDSILFKNKGASWFIENEWQAKIDTTNHYFFSSATYHYNTINIIAPDTLSVELWSWSGNSSGSYQLTEKKFKASKL